MIKQRREVIDKATQYMLANYDPTAMSADDRLWLVWQLNHVLIQIGILMEKRANSRAYKVALEELELLVSGSNPMQHLVKGSVK